MGRIGQETGGDRGALCCCAVLLCVLLCVELLCGVVVRCYCAVLACSVFVQVGALGAGGMRARRGCAATGGAGGGRGGGERRDGEDH